MNKQEIFEFLRDNLSFEIEENNGTDYGRSYREVFFFLKLTDPATGKAETLSEQRISLE